MEISNSPSFSTMSVPSKNVSGSVATSTVSEEKAKHSQARIEQQKTIEKAKADGINHAEKSIEENQANRSATREEMALLAKNMNKSLNPLSTNVQFEFGEDIGGLYINVIDSTTDTVIRRFPSEDAVRLSERMKEIVGMMFDKKI